MMMLLVACNSTGVDFPGTGGAGGSAGGDVAAQHVVDHVLVPK